MKLGVAKRRLLQLDRRLDELCVVLSRGPRGGVSDALEGCNALLSERGALETLVRETEATTVLEGNSLVDMQSALLASQKRLELLFVLEARNDLEEDQRVKLFEQIETFRTARDQLERSIETCLWETDLLDA